MENTFTWCSDIAQCDPILNKQLLCFRNHRYYDLTGLQIQWFLRASNYNIDMRNAHDLIYRMHVWRYEYTDKTTCETNCDFLDDHQSITDMKHKLCCAGETVALICERNIVYLFTTYKINDNCMCHHVSEIDHDFNAWDDIVNL